MSLIDKALRQADREGQSGSGNRQAGPGPSIRKAAVLVAIAVGGVGALLYVSQVPEHSPPRSVQAENESPATAPATCPSDSDAAPGAEGLERQAQPPAETPPAEPTTQPAVAAEPTEPEVQVQGAPTAEDPDEQKASFELGGIMQSGGVANAIVNNHLVAVGDEIDGARVVSIDKHHVVLDLDGKRIVLRF